MKRSLRLFSTAWSIFLACAFRLQAQDAYSSSPEDSLDVMTQMWYALPAAEVGGIALAGGAQDASEVPGSMQRLSSKMLRQMSFSNPIQTLHALAGVNLVSEDGFGLLPTWACAAQARSVRRASP